MKATIKFSILMIFCALLTGNIDAIAKGDTKTETVKIYGNCGMCKKNIEGALRKKDGIKQNNWNKESKMLEVTYDPSKISMTEIKQKIADAGYDSDEVRASDDAYNGLHKCCQYERPE